MTGALAQVAAIVSALAVLVGAVAGFLKVVNDSRSANARALESREKRRREDEIFIRDMYSHVVERVTSEYDNRMSGRDEDIKSLRSRLTRAEDRIEEMRATYNRSHEASMQYIEYLLGLLALHAAHVKVKPPPPELTKNY